jgi:hypothetical protein
MCWPVYSKAVATAYQDGLTRKPARKEHDVQDHASMPSDDLHIVVGHAFRDMRDQVVVAEDLCCTARSLLS